MMVAVESAHARMRGSCVTKGSAVRLRAMENPAVPMAVVGPVGRVMAEGLASKGPAVHRIAKGRNAETTDVASPVACALGGRPVKAACALKRKIPVHRTAATRSAETTAVAAPVAPARLEKCVTRIPTSGPARQLLKTMKKGEVRKEARRLATLTAPESLVEVTVVEVSAATVKVKGHV